MPEKNLEIRCWKLMMFIWGWNLKKLAHKPVFLLRKTFLIKLIPQLNRKQRSSKFYRSFLEIYNFNNFFLKCFRSYWPVILAKSLINHQRRQGVGG